jgi:hypothetical protein
VRRFEAIGKAVHFAVEDLGYKNGLGHIDGEVEFPSRCAGTFFSPILNPAKIYGIYVI